MRLAKGNDKSRQHDVELRRLVGKGMSRKAQIAALALSGVMLSGPAFSQTFNQFVGFGDSTIDSGWYRNLAFPTGNATVDALLPGAVANGGGVSTTGPGPVSSALLAGYFGLNGNPANQGGANYATGGARNNQTGAQPNAVSTVTQIGNYLAAGNGAANANALYLIGSGGNDVSLYFGQISASTITLAQGLTNVTRSANDLVGAISRLHSAGARYVIVPNQPQSFGTATEQTLRTTYDTALWQGLAAAGIDFIPADYNAMLRAVTADLSSFGFIAGAGPACIAPPGVTSGYALLCTPLTLVAPNAMQTHLFADDIHLSTAGQKIVADYEYSLVVAPSMMSMLAEAPVQTRSALIGVIQNQIPISQRQRGPTGFNTWLSGDVSSLKIKNYPGFPDDPGTPVSLIAGFDYKLPEEWLFGVALSVGQQNASFSQNFGGFKQNEFSVSAYAAHRAGPVWLNVIATYGTVKFDVTRSVPVGITIQNNTASTSGSNISLAGEAGYDFKAGALTHGPVAGMTVQQVHIDGFTESGSFTSLGFAAQTRNSAVSELGYQASYEAGRWRPFAKAAWDHEFASPDRNVTASLTTSVAPSYSLPAIVTGTDWAVATAGTTLKLSPNATGLVAVTGQAAQKNVAAYGGQLGVNVAF
jgi:outer membrane lipase/esterase